MKFIEVTEFKDENFKSNELSKCPFTGAGTSAKFSAGRGQTNRDFWPNSLNLKILSQHSNLTNPMDKKFNYAKEFKKINYKTADGFYSKTSLGSCIFLVFLSGIIIIVL